MGYLMEYMVHGGERKADVKLQKDNWDQIGQCLDFMLSHLNFYLISYGEF